MPNRNIEFLVALNGQSPRNLSDSIRRVRNASAGFVQSWTSGAHDDAYETSQEAFEHLDYIQNEILRQRDARKNSAGWSTSPFKSALQAPAGLILSPLNQIDAAWFANLPSGSGSFPHTTTPTTLTLEAALNKLKHRDTIAINFSINPNHALIVHTRAGMGQPDSLSELDVLTFCQACAAITAHI